MAAIKNKSAGIDVSKDTINVHFNGSDYKYANSVKGWNRFIRDVPGASVYAMEATGNYHYRLAVYLKNKGKRVMVFNPANVKWWIKSLRNKTKTDKRDARLISQYSNTEEAKDLPEWELLLPKLMEARVIVSLLDGLSRLALSVGNMNHAASYVLGKANALLNVMPSVNDSIKEQQSILEKKLCRIIADVYPRQFCLLQSIPGIGSKTAAVMLAGVRDIEAFGSAGQLVSYIGLAPRIVQSGTSINARGGIVKSGNVYLRSLLFMCAFSAVSKNALCKDLYDRLVAKGKSKKLAMAAVMHRLVKISYGVVKSGEPYRGCLLSNDF
jgi:transposase